MHTRTPTTNKFLHLTNHTLSHIQNKNRSKPYIPPSIHFGNFFVNYFFGFLYRLSVHFFVLVSNLFYFCIVLLFPNRWPSPIPIHFFHQKFLPIFSIPSNNNFQTILFILNMIHFKKAFHNPFLSELVSYWKSQSLRVFISSQNRLHKIFSRHIKCLSQLVTS